MKFKAILWALALSLFASAVCYAATNLNMGTWKLNEAKSKIAAGAPKNHTVVYEAAAGNEIKVTVDGTDSAGNATHNEWKGKFNGKFFPVTGDATSDERSYKVINAHQMLLTARKDTTVTLTGSIVVSANGRMRTVTTWGTDANGKKFKNVAVYDKE